MEEILTPADGVQVRVDKDGLIGWMSDWGALYGPLNWIARGLVEVVPHNSGGLGGASYRLRLVR